MAVPAISTLSNCLNGNGAAVMVSSHSSPDTASAGMAGADSCAAQVKLQVSQHAAAKGRMVVFMKRWRGAFFMAHVPGEVAKR